MHGWVIRVPTQRARLRYNSGCQKQDDVAVVEHIRGLLGANSQFPRISSSSHKLTNEELGRQYVKHHGRVNRILDKTPLARSDAWFAFLLPLDAVLARRVAGASPR